MRESYLDQSVSPGLAINLFKPYLITIPVLNTPVNIFSLFEPLVLASLGKVYVTNIVNNAGIVMYCTLLTCAPYT